MEQYNLSETIFLYVFEINRTDCYFLIGRALKQNYVDQGNVLTSVFHHNFLTFYPQFTGLYITVIFVSVFITFHQCSLPSKSRSKKGWTTPMQLLVSPVGLLFYPTSARSSSLLTVDSDYRFCVCLSIGMHIHENVF